jgi:hypothetical protein
MLEPEWKRLNFKDGFMADKSQVFDGLLHFASTPQSRSMVTLAAVSFAVCHLVVMGTSAAPMNGTADSDLEIPRQLMHFAAELCRFALPLGVVVVGIIRGRSKQSTGAPRARS